MFLCPRYCCKARVSWPSLASLNPQAWRSMCGWIGNGILAASPTRWMRRWKPMGPISGGEEVLAQKWGGLFWATSLEKIYRQPRGRVNGQSRHGRIWQFMRQNMNSPASADYRIEL